MIYSRFDDTTGMYDLFEDAAGRAVNSDLPVPVLGTPVNGIGVPASEAGRPIPSGAKFVGKSWHARGMVAAPGEAATQLSGVSDAEDRSVLAILAFAGVALLAVYLVSTPKEGGERRR